MGSGAAESPVYVDPDTKQQVPLTVGQNVELAGALKTQADNARLEPIGRIQGIHVATDGRVLLDIGLFAAGAPATEGGIGTFVKLERDQPPANVRPLPWSYKPLPTTDEQLQDALKNVTCQALNTAAPWACARCAGAPTSPDNVSALFNDVTAAAAERKTFTFSCPAGSDLEGACRVVSFAVEQDPATKTNRFFLVGVPSDAVLQTAFLQAYGVRASPAYLRAVKWSQLPAFQDLKRRAKQLQQDCTPVQPADILHTLQQILELGYQRVRE